MAASLRVLITGASGFFGSAIARACVQAGIEVSAIRRADSKLARLEEVIGRIAFFNNSDSGIDSALNRRPDAIVHTATCYGRSGEPWRLLLETNTMFPLRLLEKAMNSGVGLFINIDTVLDPKTNVYALSKRQFADWGRIAAELGTVRFANVRLEHLYGPGDDPSRFVPYIIQKCLANADSVPLTEGRQLRDFIHIDDAAAAILTLVRAGARFPAGWSEFELGSGMPVSIRQLVEQIHRLTESKATLCFGAIPYRVNEPMRSVADTSKLTELGWACRVALDDGLLQTIKTERAGCLASPVKH